MAESPPPAGSAVSLLHHLSPPQQEALSRVMIDLDIQPGHVLFREGQRAGGSEGLYLLREGQLTVSVERPSGGFAVLRTLQPGEVVGLIGLLAPDHTRRATVVAPNTARVSHLTRQAFLTLVSEGTALSCAFQHAVAAQLVHDLRRVDHALRRAMDAEGVVDLEELTTT